jgi:hypothetical protein
VLAVHVRRGTMRMSIVDGRLLGVKMGSEDDLKIVN